MDGLRACMSEEFSSIYIFNLRGNQRTSGEISRQEGGKIFGSGARTPVAITLLVKNPDKSGPATVRYHDIGDYLSREEKLKLIASLSSINGLDAALKWKTLKPNAEHDWINQRDPAFEKFVPLADSDEDPSAVFADYSLGLSTNRDTWVYGFSMTAVVQQMLAHTEFARAEAKRLHATFPNASRKELEQELDEFLDGDRRKVAWSVNLKKHVVRNIIPDLDQTAVRLSAYRPFCKQHLLYQASYLERPGRTSRMFPKTKLPNVAICVTSAGNRGDFSTIATDLLPDYHYADKSGGSQCFPLYLYEKADESTDLSFDKSEIIDGYRRRDAITDAILKTFRGAYGPKVTKEDIFYYAYGILHSPEYRNRFAADLKKMLPRIPLTTEAKDFKAFSTAGRELAEWHLNYETVTPWDVIEHADKLTLDPWELFKVQKMTFARPTVEQKKAGLKWDKTKINYNGHVTLSDIPLGAYDYVVNGKPAIEWIIERYQVTRDKDSGISNDPNDWRREHKQPRYIIDLVKRVVRVSMETMKIVAKLPALNERIDPTPSVGGGTATAFVPVPILEAVELMVAILDELKPAHIQRVAAERIFILAVNRQARERFEHGTGGASSLISKPGNPFQLMWQTVSAMAFVTISPTNIIERTSKSLDLTNPSHRELAKDAVELFKRCEAMDREWPIEVDTLEYIV